MQHLAVNQQSQKTTDWEYIEGRWEVCLNQLRVVSNAVAMRCQSTQSSVAWLLVHLLTLKEATQAASPSDRWKVQEIERICDEALQDIRLKDHVNDVRAQLFTYWNAWGEMVGGVPHTPCAL